MPYGISVICHPAPVTFPPLPQPKLVLDLSTQEGCKAELNLAINFSPYPTGGAYSAPPDLLAGLKGPTSKGGKGRGGAKMIYAFGRQKLRPCTTDTIFLYTAHSRKSAGYALYL